MLPAKGVESLPGELARGVSQLYEIDVQTRVVLRKLESYCEQKANALTDEEKRELLAKLQLTLLELRAIGDEKMTVASSIQESVSVHVRACTLTHVVRTRVSAGCFLLALW